MNHRLPIMMLITLVWAGCEGPEGPQGPIGSQGERREQGPRGPQGISGEASDIRISLIEQTFQDKDFNEELQSFFLRDFRVEPSAVLAVYVKSFFTNTGDSYYISINHFNDLENNTATPVLVQILDGGMRFIDINRILSLQTVVVVLIR